MIKNEIIFQEIQRFHLVWVWCIILLIAAFFWYIFLKQVVCKIPVGSRPAPAIVIVIFWIIFGIGLPFLFYSTKLITEIRNDGIYFRFSPFHSSYQKIPFDEITRYEARTYRPIKEYGGWGIRGIGKNKAYNIRGNKGLQLELINGKRILIGSQNPQKLVQAINAVHDNKR